MQISSDKPSTVEMCAEFWSIGNTNRDLCFYTVSSRRLNVSGTSMRTDIQPREATEEPTRRERVAAGLVCMLVFVVIYVLSAGPMAGLHTVFEFKQFQDALEVVYGPVIVLGESDIEPIASLLRSYIGLFR